MNLKQLSHMLSLSQTTVSRALNVAWWSVRSETARLLSAWRTSGTPGLNTCSKLSRTSRSNSAEVR